MAIQLVIYQLSCAHEHLRIDSVMALGNQYYLFLCICLVYIQCVYCERGVATTWGFSRPVGRIETIVSHETKSGIILFTRTATITFPDVRFIDNL